MIELHGVSKTVPSGDTMLTILHPLDLRIDSGRVAAIVGPSGSGKSTLLGLLAGLDAPSTGRIVIDGEDITAMSEDALARFRGTRIGKEDGLAVDAHRAGIAAVDPGEDLHQGRLAGPVRAEQGHHLARRHDEIDMGEHGNPAERFADAAHLEPG